MSAISAQAVSTPAGDTRIERGHHVLHPLHGLGQVFDSSKGVLTVRFRSGTETVRQEHVSRVIPVTALARMIAAISPVTAWTIRKANDRGYIQPDAVDRFAGHRVHYYDVVRIPAIIRELSRPEPWAIGTLVSHSRYGVGVISGCEVRVGPGGGRTLRLVQFHGPASEVSVSTADLRRLVPSHAVARQLNVSRRSFRNLAASRGIFPDYIAPIGRGREFYDESRLAVVCSTWNEVERATSTSLRRLVLTAEGQPARIVNQDSRGNLLVKSVHRPEMAEWSERSKLQDLVSLRELARRQGFSRYKLNRLLAAVGIVPVHQHGTTLYFDRIRAEEALRTRLSDERDAVALPALADRTGVSVPVLANKVRAGCIQTLGHHAAHYVSAGEARRVEQVVRELRNRSGVEQLGICRLHPRGRAGYEVAAWDIDALVHALRRLSIERHPVLFGQVAWLAEGAGERRLREALDGYVESIQTCSEGREIREAASCLLSLIQALPPEFSAYAPRLGLLSSGEIQQCLSLQRRIRSLAGRAGCDSRRSLQQFCSVVHSQLNAVLRSSLDCGFSSVGHCVGSVVVAVRDGKPQTGTVVCIERECWNPLMRCWHRTLMVRFEDGDRRIRLDEGLRSGQESAVLLLSNSEVSKLIKLLSAGRTNAGTNVLKIAS